jgi:hypothetical protein
MITMTLVETFEGSDDVDPFVEIEVAYVPREGETILWNGDMFQVPGRPLVF